MRQSLPDSGRHQALRALLIVAGVASLFAGCASLPEGATVVPGFDKSRYLGTWYEIARFDFTFEKNLDNTTATYTLRKDGRIGVLNKGYNYITKRWQEAKGKARFRGSDTVPALEVSFFGPFYAAYNVIALDPEYRYALVAGSSLSYLWILSRTTTIPDEVKTEYVALARKLGYNTDALIWVRHGQ